MGGTECCKANGEANQELRTGDSKGKLPTEMGNESELEQKFQELISGIEIMNQSIKVKAH